MRVSASKPRPEVLLKTSRQLSNKSCAHNLNRNIITSVRQRKSLESHSSSSRRMVAHLSQMMESSVRKITQTLREQGEPSLSAWHYFATVHLHANANATSNISLTHQHGSDPSLGKYRSNTVAASLCPDRHAISRVACPEKVTRFTSSSSYRDGYSLVPSWPPSPGTAASLGPAPHYT